MIKHIIRNYIELELTIVSSFPLLLLALGSQKGIFLSSNVWKPETIDISKLQTTLKATQTQINLDLNLSIIFC